MNPTELARARVQVADVVRLIVRTIHAESIQYELDGHIVIARAYQNVADFVQSRAMDVAAELAEERAQEQEQEQTEEGK